MNSATHTTPAGYLYRIVRDEDERAAKSGRILDRFETGVEFYCEYTKAFHPSIVRQCDLIGIGVCNEK